MTGNAMSTTDLRALARLVDRYGFDALRDAVQAASQAVKPQAGAPSHNDGNRACIWACVEFRCGDGARRGARGVSAVTNKLADEMGKYFRGRKMTHSRIRSLYYEARVRRQNDLEFISLSDNALENFKAGAAKDHNALVLPCLMFPDGNVERGLIIDRGALPATRKCVFVISHAVQKSDSDS
jgi:hypothetical protein